MNPFIPIQKKRNVFYHLLKLWSFFLWYPVYRCKQHLVKNLCLKFSHFRKWISLQGFQEKFLFIAKKQVPEQYFTLDTIYYKSSPGATTYLENELYSSSIYLGGIFFLITLHSMSLIKLFIWYRFCMSVRYAGHHKQTECV